MASKASSRKSKCKPPEVSLILAGVIKTSALVAEMDTSHVLLGSNLEALRDFVMIAAVHQGYVLFDNGSCGLAVYDQRSVITSSCLWLVVDQIFKPTCAQLEEYDAKVNFRYLTAATVVGDHIQAHWTRLKQPLKDAPPSIQVLELYKLINSDSTPWPFLVFEPPSLYTSQDVPLEEGEEPAPFEIFSLSLRFADDSVLTLSPDGPEVWEAMNAKEQEVAKKVRGSDYKFTTKIDPLTASPGQG